MGGECDGSPDVGRKPLCLVWLGTSRRWLPAAYSAQLYQARVGRVYEHVYESYWGEGLSNYSEAA